MFIDFRLASILTARLVLNLRREGHKPYKDGLSTGHELSFASNLLFGNLGGHLRTGNGIEEYELRNHGNKHDDQGEYLWDELMIDPMA